MDLCVKLYLFLSVGSLVGGRFVFHEVAGNRNCSWGTVVAFDRDQALDSYDLLLSSYRDDGGLRQHDCVVISTKAWIRDKISAESRPQSETLESVRDRFPKRKTHVVLKESKVSSPGSWLRNVLSKSWQVVQVEAVCKGSNLPSIRKCFLLSVRGKPHLEVGHLRLGRSILNSTAESAEDNSVKAIFIVLICVAVAMFGLAITLFLCAKKTCSSAVTNVEECVVDGGSYKVITNTADYSQVSGGDAEEAATQSQPLINQEESNASSESVLDENKPMKGEDSSRKSTAESQDTINTNSMQNGDGRTFTTSSERLYEEVLKDESPAKENEPMEVANPSQTSNEQENSEAESGKSNKNRRSKKILKVNIKSSEAFKVDDGQVTPSSASSSSKNPMKWLKRDGRKHSEEGKANGEAYTEATSESKMDRQRMSSPDINRQSLLESRPLPPSPISPSHLPNNEAALPGAQLPLDLQQDYYEAVNQRTFETDDATYESCELNQSDSELYTSIDENNRRVSLCASDTYDSVTATVRTVSSGDIYEVVNAEETLSSTEAGSSPPVPPMDRLRAVSERKKSSHEWGEVEEGVAHSPTQGGPSFDDVPSTTENDAFVDYYAKPDMEKKRLSKKKRQSEARSCGSEFESFSDECAYEPVSPAHQRSVDNSTKKNEDSPYTEIPNINSSAENETAPVEDPYSVPPELPFRPPGLDEGLFPEDNDHDYEQYIPDKTGTASSVQTSLNLEDVKVNPYEACENPSSEKKGSSIEPVDGSDVQSKDSECHYEELNVSKETDTDKLW